MKKNPILILLMLLAFAGTASAGSFVNQNTALDKREKMKAAVKAAFEKTVVQKFGDAAPHTKGGRIALRVTVFDSQARQIESLKRRSASKGTATPDKPESFVYLCDISTAGEPMACFEIDAKFLPKRNVEISVDGVRTDKDPGMQVLYPGNAGSPRKVTSSNPDSLAQLRDLKVSLPAARGAHHVEFHTYWHLDFFFPNVEEVLVEPIGVLFSICRKEGATDAEDKVEFQFGFVPYDGKFPASPMLTANDIPLTPIEPSKIGPDPDFPFATLVTVVISAKNYGDVEKSSADQGGLIFALKGVGNELSFEWLEPYWLPSYGDLTECESVQ